MDIFFFKIWDRRKNEDDQVLGELCINLEDELKEHSEMKGWFDLQPIGEKKKKKNGKIKLRIYKNEPEEERIVEEDTPEEVQEEETENNKFINHYTIGRELGRGGFSIVYEGTKIETNENFAIKVIATNQDESQINTLRSEIDIMKKLKHRNIIQLFDVYEEPDNIYLVIELVTGGELFDHIIDKGNFSERDAANIIKQVIEAVAFMHDNGIAHRDLKPENILVTGPDNDIIKVSDFGLSKDFERQAMISACGTPDYVAPEVLMAGQAGYNNSVDLWSIGVITYILLCGFPPFYGSSDQEIFAKILKGDIAYPSPDWDNISTEAKDFVKALLSYDYSERPTAQDCMTAPWIVELAPNTELSNPNFRQKVTKYNEVRKKTKNNIVEIPLRNNKQ